MISMEDSACTKQNLAESAIQKHKETGYELSAVICRDFSSPEMEYEVFTTQDLDRWSTNSGMRFTSLEMAKEHMKLEYLVPVLVTYK